MRKTYRVLGYLLAAEVMIQAMAIAYALSGLTHWVADEGGVLNKAVIEDRESTPFPEVLGFAIHGINGTMLIPLLALLLLVVSFFAKVAGGTRWAAIALGLVVVQVLLGVNASNVPFTGALHALNAFAILVVALSAARAAGGRAAAAVTEGHVGASV